jgi:hypothetical protein
MSATNTAETNFLALIFQNANYASIGDATGLRGSSTAGSFQISLTTAAPADTDSQTTNETAYTSYGRVAVARSSGAWTATSGNSDNVAAINFPTCTGGTSSIVGFGIGTDSTGTGNLIFNGALTATLAVSNGITPSFAIGALDVTLD